MPAEVVLVHDDETAAGELLDALRRARLDVAWLARSMAALDALEGPDKIQLLITKINFATPPHGLALARMARYKRQTVQVLFIGDAEDRDHTIGLGEFLANPLTADNVVGKAVAMLGLGPANLC